MSNSFKITGLLHSVDATEKKKENFQVRKFRISFMDGKYEKTPEFQAVNDRCDMLDNYAEGEMVTVHFEIDGREWQGKYFTSLKAWKIERIAPEQPVQPRPQSVKPHTPAPVAPGDEMPGADDDLPF